MSLICDCGSCCAACGHEEDCIFWSRRPEGDAWSEEKEADGLRSLLTTYLQDSPAADGRRAEIRDRYETAARRTPQPHDTPTGDR